MGAEPWSYFVPFEASVESAMRKLQKRVFDSGEYNGSELKPRNVMEALENSYADGTRSILDMMSVGNAPGLGTLGPLREDQLQQYFGTTQPTHDTVEEGEFWDDLDRGMGIYIIVYKDGKPDEYFFAGYSFD